MERDRQSILERIREQNSSEDKRLIKEKFFSRKDIEFFNNILQLITQLNIYLNHFPRHEKYALSNRIRDNVYLIYDLIVEVRRKYYKKTSLTQLDIAFEKLKMQIFLAWNLGYFDYHKEQKFSDDPSNSSRALKRYSVLQKMLNRVGDQIGALIKSSQENEKW